MVQKQPTSRGGNDMVSKRIQELEEEKKPDGERSNQPANTIDKSPELDAVSACAAKHAALAACAAKHAAIAAKAACGAKRAAGTVRAACEAKHAACAAKHAACAAKRAACAAKYAACAAKSWTRKPF
jgi:hypothetical protein